MDKKELLRRLCEAPGVNGEDGAAKIVIEYLSVYTDRISVDGMGNVTGLISSEQPDVPTLLLEAHLDEIGFVVTGIDGQGFVHVSNCGGIDNRTLSAAEVVFLSEPPMYGVFCSTPPHLSKGEDSQPELTARGIDVGLTKEEAEQRLPIGTRAVFRPHFDCLLGDRVCAKALDNRAGVAAVLGALDAVKGKSLPFNLAISFCTQEEIGSNGAKTAAFALMPDAAIVVDVSFAASHDMKKSEYGVLGNGAMIGQAPTLNRLMTEQLFRLAEKQGIAVQHEVIGSRTGTDADAIGITGRGIPCALLSIPQRYMHTPVEVVSLGDVEAVSQLMAAFILSGEVPSYD